MHPPEDLTVAPKYRKWLGKADFELMQYTGTTDERGVEIYEGDIIREAVSPVGGKDGGYLFKSRIVEWLGAESGYHIFHCEVIGNIHQNPELLETSK